jgi:NADH-quinone oxidoreductase subunit J
MDLYTLLFYVFAAVTGFSALAVVVTQNIVRAATWLLFTLAGASGVFFLLGANFIGATQLLIYVGGTLVLVVFGVMLTAQGPFISMRIGAGEWAIALVVGLLVFGVLAVSLVTVRPPREARREATTEGQRKELLGSKYLGAALLGDRRVTPPAEITGVGNRFDKQRATVSYLLPFEIVSIHLLVVLIGAAYLARAKRRRVGSELTR